MGTLRHKSSRDLIYEVILEISGRLPDFLETPPRCCNGKGWYIERGAEMRYRGQYPPLSHPPQICGLIGQLTAATHLTTVTATRASRILTPGRLLESALLANVRLLPVALTFFVGRRYKTLLDPPIIHISVTTKTPSFPIHTFPRLTTTPPTRI